MGLDCERGEGSRMITRKNMDRGLVLMELFTNDFQKFETEIDKPSKKHRELIALRWRTCSLRIGEIAATLNISYITFFAYSFCCI